MKKTRLSRLLVVITLLFTGSITQLMLAQTTMPEILETGTLEEQMQYINDRTRIYENYRAIREDMFQKIKNNALDSLNKSKEGIRDLNESNAGLEKTIINLNQQITTISEEKDAAISNRDSLLFFGMTMTKSAYNKLLWTIIIILLSLTVLVFLLFKRSNSVTKVAQVDLEDIKKEFEEFRRVAHENKEKLIVGHFNEIKKLKEMGR